MLLLLSFNYTAPPAHVIKTGENLTLLLFALLLLVPKTRLGACIGAVGAAAITYWVTGHAGGDMGGLSQLIEPPIWAMIGAIIGAGISLLSKVVFNALSQANRSQSKAP